MKTKKIDTFVYQDLGFPINLINVPMKKVFGEWVLDIDLNQLQLVVLRSLLYKAAPLNGNELRFIRKFLNMTMADFGRIFGISHVAVLKWENGKTHTHPSMDVCIRLYILDYLHAKDKEFRNLYSKITLEKLSKSKEEKIHRISIDVAEDFKIAL